VGVFSQRKQLRFIVDKQGCIESVICVIFAVSSSNGKHTSVPNMLAENSSSIHSGHFMVSCIHEADDDAETVANVKTEPDRQAYNFEAADRQLRKTYMFGNRSTHALAIDASLTKLFECMTLAYR